MTTLERPRTAAWACPDCRAPIEAPVAACPACGLRLVGREADELRAVLHEIARLQTRAGLLVAALRQPVASPAGPGGVLAAPSAGQPPAHRPTRPGRLRPHWGVQQLLYALGALLLLAGASVFVLAVWFIVGLPGQVVIMGGFTLAALLAARATAARRLGGASETAGALGLGLLVIDLVAAYRLDLAGLRSIDPPAYGCAASVLFVAVAAGLHLEQRRGSRVALRPVTGYLPGAAFGWATASWFAIGWIGAHGLAKEPVLLAAALATGVVTPLALRARTRTTTAGGAHLGLRRGLLTATAVVAAATAAVTGLVFLVSDLVLAYDLEHGPRDVRWGAGLLLAAVALAAWPLLRGRIVLHRAWPASLPVLGGVVLGLGSLAVDVPRVAWAAATPALGVLAVLSLLPAAPGRLREPGDAALRGAVALLRSAPVATTLATLWLAAIGARSVVELARSGQVAGDLEAGWLLLTTGSLLLAAAAAARLSAPAPAAAWSVGLGPLWALSVGFLSFDLVGGTTGDWLLLGGALTSLLLGAVAAGRRRRALEVGALLADLVLVPTALVQPLNDEATVRLTIALLAVGLALFWYAAVPRRLGVAYPAALATAAATWVVSGEAGLDLVEAYTVPLAVLLLGVGLVQQRRRLRAGGPALPSPLTLGPALGVALLPSLAVALGEGSVVRTALVALAAVGLLVLGVQRTLLAPVLYGALALALLALDRGGPYLAAVPAWVTLSAAGVVLLTLAVRWESAVRSGRRAGTWLGALR